MTGIYEYSLIRAPLAISCPACAAEAVFRTSHDHALPVLRRDRHFDPPREDWSGEVRCLSCTKAGPHQLDWPADAYYRVEYEGQALWALDRPMLLAFREFIAAGADRAQVRPYYKMYFLRIPTVFLTARARAPMLKQIDRLLSGSG